MRRLLLAAALALPLAGCFDADVTLDFKDAETVDTVMSFSMTRQLFDMGGKPPAEACADGRHELTTDRFTCHTEKTMTVDEFIAEAETRAAESPVDRMREAALVERLADDRLRVTLDFAEMAQGGGDLQEMRAMAGMMRAALAGHSLVFRIRAPQIDETTGTLSEDGTEAEYILPLTAILDATPPASFVTTVTLKSCTLWIFC
ncbi:hypothetical protein [Szabonella alba]|uniref:Lipoprotein n=1 Tax=Szabonella alba TaxID=2804194 RepID=A0A8K0XZ79_9RHOB|nr:hypothetical protein [Szabonella alba]MBL4915798.1 hypothetical protein [Szabonella alba]